MKRKMITLLCACFAVMAVAGCGDSAESETEAALSTQMEEEAGNSAVSLSLSYDAKDYVTLGDYMGLQVSLQESDYEMTEEMVNNYVDQQISYYKPFLPDDSKTVVEKGDIVDVNYVGKKDGEAFEGGSADNQMIDTAANADAQSGSGYIEGFSDGLIGANVGDTVDSEVTFPENYQAEDLKGQKAVFTFTVNAICKKVERENIDDAFVKEYLEADSVDALYENARSYLQEQLDTKKHSDIRDAVIAKLTETSTVDALPEGLLEARLEEYVESFRSYYCSDGTELSTFLEDNYQTTEEDFLKESRAYLEENLKQELILQAIAGEENIPFDQAEFDAYIENVIANGGYESPEALYGSLGADAADGEKYFNNMYMANEACELLVENAAVAYEKTEAETEEGTEQTAE